MNKIIHFFFLFGLFLVGCTGEAVAEEQIHRYHTQIEVLKTGDILVTETIEAQAEGRQIKRGIYRDLPLFRRTFLGGYLPTDYDILSVKRDGEQESYHTEESDDGYLRVYFGKSSYFLPKGIYTYEFKYKVSSQVFFYDDFDELNWNVIGHSWDFPILQATAEVVSPQNAPLDDYAVYTGKVLSKGQDFIAREVGNNLQVMTTKTLAPGQGMTVAVAWPSGYIEPQEDMIGWAFFWKQHPGFLIALLGFLTMAGYYYYAWNEVGRDPGSRGLAPFYTPPDGISPAMAAYIESLGDAPAKRCVSAAIMSLAAKGYYTIEQQSASKYKITRTEDLERRPEISEDEAILYDAIGRSLTLSRSSTTMIKASDDLMKKLNELCHGRYFMKNSWWWFYGLLPFAATLFLLATSGVAGEEFWIGSLFMMVFGGVSLSVFIFAVKSLITGAGTEKAQAVFLILWSSMFSIGGFMGFFLAASSASWLLLITLLLSITLFGLMRVPMKAPTRRGQEVMDHIFGLKYYMEDVEGDILKQYDPPEMSRDLYERYLPYAVALEVEAKWADKFTFALGAATAAAMASATSPHWYRSSYGGLGSGGFSASSMVSSFGSALSAASSSSSSSGGGSSGGGGGGGGGGGW